MSASDGHSDTLDLQTMGIAAPMTAKSPGACSACKIEACRIPSQRNLSFSCLRLRAVNDVVVRYCNRWKYRVRAVVGEPCKIEEDSANCLRKGFHQVPVKIREALSRAPSSLAVPRKE